MDLEMSLPMKTRLVVLFSVLVLVIAACGGDSTVDETSTTDGDSTSTTEGVTSSTAEETSTTAASGEPLKIAAIADSSGNLAFFGIQANRGWDLAIEVVGATAGGRPIEYVKVQCETPADCAADTERVIREEGVEIVMGTPGSALALAISDAAARLGIPYFETASLTMDLLPPEGEESEFIFRGAPNDVLIAEAGVNGALLGLEELGIDPATATAVMINESSASNNNQADVIIDQLEALGVEILDHLEYDINTIDASSLAARASSLDPTLLVNVSYLVDGIPLQTELAQQGFRPQVHVLQSTGSERDYWEALGTDYLQGRFGTPYPGLDTPGIEDFLEAYEETFGEPPPSSHPLTYYSSALMLFDIIDFANGVTDPESFREAVMTIDRPLGTYPNGWGASFAPNGQNERAFMVSTQWHDGETACAIAPEIVASCELISPEG